MSLWQEGYSRSIVECKESKESLLEIGDRDIVEA